MRHILVVFSLFFLVGGAFCLASCVVGEGSESEEETSVDDEEGSGSESEEETSADDEEGSGSGEETPAQESEEEAGADTAGTDSQADTQADQDTSEEESDPEITFEVSSGWSGPVITVNNLGICGSQDFDTGGYNVSGFTINLTCYPTNGGEESHVLVFYNITYSNGVVSSFNVTIDDQSYTYP